MLKKSDLSKQFEMVVQQEIKNYQDSLNFVLQSIREIKESIQDVIDENSKKYAKLNSTCGNLSIELHAIKEACFSLGLRFERSLTDQRVLNERTAREMAALGDTVIYKIKVDENLDLKIRNVLVEIQNLKQNSDKKYKILDDNLDDLLRLLRREISNAKQEILDAPTSASIIKTQLEEKISSHKVDVTGIMKELRIYKHENMVTQKKIENIYTLIERLNKSEAKK